MANLEQGYDQPIVECQATSAPGLTGWPYADVDMVNSPPHYCQGEIECVDAIRAALTQEEFVGYCKGNALKYIWREKHKGGLQDVKKAIYYLEKL